MMRGSHARRSRLVDRLTGVIAVILVLAGVLTIAYPTIADMLANRQHENVVSSYTQSVSRLDQDKRDAMLADARKYNESLKGDPVHDPFIPGSGYALPDNYTEVLNPDGDGVMGYLSIPKIKLRLPIYHGTDEETLAKGVGHMRQTALPIGGKGLRPVLTGHRGLPSAELFTRLDELTDGDIFTINVLGSNLAYRVVQIQTVLPDQLEELRAIPGRDLVTLVTCTPYGINTHRLLITGERTKYVPESNVASAGSLLPSPGSSRWIRWISLTSAVITIAVLLAVLYAWRRRHAISNTHHDVVSEGATDGQS
ncbi:class C sortase [Bifidobacterium cebidarum]|nr:class C sortase [Bifidobacterium cebidarum]